MATAFQSNAFQDNAFQIDAGAVVAAFRSGGGGIQPKRRKTLRLPFKPTGFGGYKKKTKVEERLEEAHADAVEIAEAAEDAGLIESREVAQTQAALQAALMTTGAASQAAMNAEIARLLKEHMRREAEDEELIILLAQIV